VTRRLKTLAEAEDFHLLRSRFKAIVALLPYAVRHERDGKDEMLDAFLRAARASRKSQFTWIYLKQIATKLLSEASPRAVVLASPHIPWGVMADRGDLVQQWATATSAVLYTEEVGQSVVNVLLRIASVDRLVPSIPVDVWSWLSKQPPLPPICLGRDVATRGCVVKAVRALKDVEILKSYLLLVWSEWDELQDSSGFNKMCALIREDFSGIGVGRQRAELIQRLDHVLGQLDQGSEHLKQQNLQFDRYYLWKAKRRYRKLKEILMEVERRTSSLMTMLFCILTLA